MQTLTRRARRHIDRPGAQLAAFIAVAGVLDLTAATGLAYVAGFGRMRSALLHPDWTWLAVMAGLLGVSFAGYYYSYRGIYRAENGYRLPARRLLAVVVAGFGGFFAHRGTSPDDVALQEAGAGQRESIVRAGALGGTEQAALAVIGCLAAITALCLRLTTPVGATLPWAVIPVPAALVVLWAAGRYAPRLRDQPGWKGRISTALDSVMLIRRLFTRPRRHASALGGMLVFWGAEIAAVWAGLLTLALPLAIWYSGAPFSVAIAGTFAYRAMTLWLPMPFSLAALPALRRIGEKAVPHGDGPGEDARAAA